MPDDPWTGPRTADEHIQANLHALLTGLGDLQVSNQTLIEGISRLRSEYELARDEAAVKPGTPEAATFATYQMALAKGLPGLTQGTLSAVTAFSKGNSLAGSAAIMDICSSLASVLGGLSTAGGPPGALIGALFSMVSMILGFFAPKPPDMITLIEKLIRDLGAEDKKSGIEAAGEAVRVYTRVCDDFMKPAVDGTVQDPEPLIREMSQLGLVEGSTIREVRIVRNWLEADGNQGLDGWPEILRLVCEVYMHLMWAVTRQNLYAHDTSRILQYVGDPMASPEKKAQWSKLQSEAKVQYENLKANNETMAEFLARIVPVARKRGVYVASYGVPAGVWIGSGPTLFRDPNSWHKLFGETRRMAITRPWDSINDAAAKYDFWVLGDFLVEGPRAYHNILNTKTRVLTKDFADYVGPYDSNEVRRWTDWWPVPIDGTTFQVYGTPDWSEGGAIDLYIWHSDANTLEKVNWRALTGRKVVQVRVAAPLAVVPEDPDAGYMPAAVSQDGRIIYGALHDSTDIFVKDGPVQEVVPTPMPSYVGIAVDPYFLWVYGDHGFACATHASVLGSIHRKLPKPRWLFPSVASNVASVRDLSSCEDRTLFVSSLSELSTAVFRVDFTTPALTDEQRLIVGAWERFPGAANASQVQKLPIYGWPLLERAVAALALELRDDGS